MPKPRHRLRWILGAILVLPLLTVALALLLFDPRMMLPRVEAAVLDATGRALTVDGPVGLHYGVTPTLTLERVALANLPDGSRPQMLVVQRVEAKPAARPLFARRAEVRKLTLVAPAPLLERNAGRAPNWESVRT